MNELYETLNVYQLLGVGCVILAVLTTCAYICWRTGYHLWCIVDDAKAKDGELWFESTIAAWIGCLVFWIGLMLGTVLFKYVIVNIPMYTCGWEPSLALYMGYAIYAGFTRLSMDTSRTQMLTPQRRRMKCM